jgi:quercetin dioxygenase-like cupin family protein
MAIVLRPGQGTRLVARGSEMLFKAVGATTGGRFSLMERSLPPHGRRPAPHRHPATVEAFLVLEGTLAFSLDDEQTTLGEGGFLLVPEGVGHTFGNEGETLARTLIFHAPALDPYFEDLAALWARPTPPTSAEELAVMRQHGLEPIGDG